jgi:hypothetical protein
MTRSASVEHAIAVEVHVEVETPGAGVFFTKDKCDKAA